MCLCVLFVYFFVRNKKLTFYSLTDKRQRGEKGRESVCMCVACMCVCVARQTSTLGQYVIDWAAGRGLLSPAMVQAGESSVSYVFGSNWQPTLVEADWGRRQSCSNPTTSRSHTLTSPHCCLWKCYIVLFEALVFLHLLRNYTFVKELDGSTCSETLEQTMWLAVLCVCVGL